MWIAVGMKFLFTHLQFQDICVSLSIKNEPEKDLYASLCMIVKKVVPEAYILSSYYKKTSAVPLESSKSQNAALL